MAYRSDRAFGERMMPMVKQIVGPRLLVSTPDEIDCKRAADLMVLMARNMTIGARVRRYGVMDKYGEDCAYQFTIRYHRDSGAETEMSKIVKGWADWMFYGHSDAAEAAIPQWWLLNLHAFRRVWKMREAGLLKLRCGLKPNGDGTHFAWFDVRSFPARPALVIASSFGRLTQHAGGWERDDPQGELALEAAP